MYSTEYFAILISLLSFLLPKIGVVISSEALTTTVQTIVTIVSALYLLYKRHKRGGVNIAGFRKA